jgi:hypothetical protein
LLDLVTGVLHIMAKAVQGVAPAGGDDRAYGDGGNDKNGNEHGFLFLF